MEINVEKLRTALKLVAPAMPKKPRLDILTSVRLGEGKVIATDLNTAITVSIGSPDDAPLCLPYKTVVDFLASVPGGQSLVVAHVDGTAELTAGRNKAVFNSPAAPDYPPIPNPTPEHVVAIDGDELVGALTAVQYCCAASDDSRPVLQGVCLALGDTPETAAADGYRLAWEPLRTKLPGEGNLIIPRQAVKALAYLWKTAPKPPTVEGASLADIARAKRLVRLAYTRESLAVTFGQVSFITKLTAGTFPNHRQLIPPPGSESVCFNAEDLWRTLKGMAKVALEGSSIIRLEWGEGELRVSTRKSDLGTVSASIAATCTGPGRIGFNFKYLQAYLTDKVDNVTLSTEGKTRAGLFSYHGVARFALMPMYVHWDGDPEPEPAPTPAKPKARRASRPRRTVSTPSVSTPSTPSTSEESTEDEETQDPESPEEESEVQEATTDNPEDEHPE